MESIGWNKIRVLVTNKCNYSCPFCHNEGQEKGRHWDMMNLDTFIQVIDILKGLDISELNISGGEPFINQQLVDMIVYANENLTCDISCATNLSLINIDDLARLAHTRIKLNIQFPFVDKEKFHQSTGNGDFEIILKHIRMVRDAGISIGLNCVIQDFDLNFLNEMLQYAIREELPLKFLPQIGNNDSFKYKEFAFPVFHQYAIDFKDKGTGALRWVVENNGHRTSILYIESPCFQKEFCKCKKFGEIRIHPDLIVQPCILTNSEKRLSIKNGIEYAQSQLLQLWKNFTTC